MCICEVYRMTFGISGLSGPRCLVIPDSGDEEDPFENQVTGQPFCPCLYDPPLGGWRYWDRGIGQLKPFESRIFR